jgi:hypothetical protein
VFKRSKIFRGDGVLRTFELVSTVTTGTGDNSFDVPAYAKS